LGKDGIVANSSPYNDKGHVREVTIVDNDGSDITGCVVPNYVGQGKGHDSLGPWELFRIFNEGLSER